MPLHGDGRANARNAVSFRNIFFTVVSQSLTKLEAKPLSPTDIVSFFLETNVSIDKFTVLSFSFRLKTGPATLIGSLIMSVVAL